MACSSKLVTTKGLPAAIESKSLLGVATLLIFVLLRGITVTDNEEKNSGAFLNNQRIRVSKKKDINQCLFATGGKKETSNNLNTRKSGSAALDLAYVGAGRYDGYFQNNLNIWDIAAGIIIVKEAGGKTNDINYSSKEELKVMAGSEAVYEKMLKILNNF